MRRASLDGWLQAAFARNRRACRLAVAAYAWKSGTPPKAGGLQCIGGELGGPEQAAAVAELASCISRPQRCRPAAVRILTRWRNRAEVNAAER